MSKIELDHIEWVNNTDPDICAENLNKNQQALEACVDVANKFNGLTNVNNEAEADYPKSKYLVNSSGLKKITDSIKAKGVDSSGIFKNIPDEIKSIKSGETKIVNEGIIYSDFLCEGIASEAILALYDSSQSGEDIPREGVTIEARWRHSFNRGEDYTETNSATYWDPPTNKKVQSTTYMKHPNRAYNTDFICSYGWLRSQEIFRERHYDQGGTLVDEIIEYSDPVPLHTKILDKDGVVCYYGGKADDPNVESYSDNLVFYVSGKYLIDNVYSDGQVIAVRPITSVDQTFKFNKKGDI